MSGLSLKFYNNLYETPPGRLIKKKDTQQLSAICLLPPRVTLYGRERPSTAGGRVQSSGNSRQSRQRPVSAAVDRRFDAEDTRTKDAADRRSRPASAKSSQSTKLAEYLFKKEAVKAQRPQSAAVSTSGNSEFDQMLKRYRSAPVHPSRKLWNRINPGHMMEEWKTSHKTITAPEYNSNPHYNFQKEFHVPKSEFLYVPKKQSIVNHE